MQTSYYFDMNYRAFILFFLLVLSLNTKAQQRTVDSLLNTIKTNSIEDTNRVECLYKLSFFLKTQKTKEALRYGNEALNLATKLNYKRGIAASYNNIGAIYDYIGRTKDAIDYFFKAYTIKKEINDSKGLASTLNNLGVIYKRDGDYNKAMKYYKLSLKYTYESNRKELLPALYMNIGRTFSKENMLDSAIFYYYKAKEIVKDNLSMMAEVYSAISVAYQNKKEPMKSILFVDSGLAIYNKLSNVKPFSFLYLNRAISFERMFRFDSASKYYEIYKIIVEAEKNLEDKSEFYKYYSSYNYNLYKRTKDRLLLEKAYLYKDLYLKTIDSTEIIEKSKFLSNLTKQIEVKELESEIENRKKEEEISKLKAKKQELIIFAVVIILVLFIVFLFLLYKKYKQTAFQKQIIDNKNKDILDSIRYAKRIQTSLLPSEKYLEKIFNKIKKSS